MNTRISLLIFFILAQAVSGISDKKHAENFKANSAKTLSLFQAEEWDALEALITKARDERLKMKRGNYLLDRYLYGLLPRELVKNRAPIEEWEAWLAKIDRWSTKHPDSLISPTVKIAYWLEFARIMKSKNEAGLNEIELNLQYQENLRTAQNIYNDSFIKRGGIYPCPEFYKYGIYLATAQEWDPEETYKTVITPLIRGFPWYHPALWLGKIQYSNSPKENESSPIDYFNRVAMDLPKELGERFYTIAVLNWDLYTRNDQLWESFDMELFKRGIPHYMKNLPNDLHHISRAIAFLSEYDTLASQYEVFRALKEEFPERMRTQIKRNKYLRSLDYSLKNSSNKLEAVRYIRPVNVLTREYVRGLAILDSGHLVSTYKDSLLLYDYQNEVIVSQMKSEGYESGKMASSKDGRYLVVEWKDRKDIENKIRMVLYRFEDQKLTEIAIANHKLGKSRTLEITPDSKKIFISTYHQAENKDHLLMWEWKTNQPIQHVHSAGLCKHWGSMCFHRSSETLYFYDDVVKKCSYVEEKSVVQTVEAFKGIKGLIYDLKSFDNDKYAALLVRERGKPSRLHISNLDDSTHLGSVALKIPGPNSFEYRLEILPTSDPNVWNMITTSSEWGVALWSIDLRNLNKAKLLSYKVTNGLSFFNTITVEKSNTLFTADSRANIYQWKISE